MNPCGGVLIPPYRDPEDRHCFVEERDLWDELAEVVWRNGRRPLQMSEDHAYPRSMFGDGPDMPRHLAHLFCQCVQAGKIGGPIGGPRTVELNVGVFAPGMRGKGVKTTNDEAHQADPTYREHKRRASKIAHDESHRADPVYRENRVCAVKTANHNRWHRDRGLTSPDCGLCEAA